MFDYLSIYVYFSSCLLKCLSLYTLFSPTIYHTFTIIFITGFLHALKITRNIYLLSDLNNIFCVRSKFSKATLFCHVIFRVDLHYCVLCTNNKYYKYVRLLYFTFKMILLYSYIKDFIVHMSISETVFI